MGASAVTRAAAEHLSGVDPVMATLVATHGPPQLRSRATPRADRFASLAGAIVYQQLAGKAAAAIHRRVVEAAGGTVTPRAVIDAGETALRGAGLSGSKFASLTSLATHVLEGSVDLDRVGRLSDDAVVAELTQVRGIGPWTAQMFLMFDLARPDVWPVLDYGVRSGYQRAYGLAALPTPNELVGLGAAFTPFRSAAAWYCWRAADTKTPHS